MLEGRRLRDAPEVPQVVRELWQHRRLVVAMAARSVKTRYAGSLLGTAWAVVEPLLQFALYLLIFGVFLGLRGLAGGGPAFALWLLAGLFPFLLLQEGWSRAAGVFRVQANLVKHVPVPCSVLLAAELLAVLARQTVILALLLLVAGLLGKLTLLGLPALFGGLLVTLALLFGGGLLLAVAGAYLADVGQVVGTLMSFAMYLTPVLYPETLVPEPLRIFVALNPFWGPVALLRRGLSLPVAFPEVGVGLLVALALASGGMVFFHRRQEVLRDLV